MGSRHSVGGVEPLESALEVYNKRLSRVESDLSPFTSIYKSSYLDKPNMFEMITQRYRKDCSISNESNAVCPSHIMAAIFPLQEGLKGPLTKLLLGLVSPAVSPCIANPQKV